MGTICPLAYGNIFMDHFRKIYIYQFLEELSLWTGSRDQLIKAAIKGKISSLLNTRYHNQVSLFLKRKFRSKTTNYAQRFIGKKQTEHFAY